MIASEEDVERALSFLRDSAAELGEARSRAIKAGHWLKHVESLEYKASDSRTEAGRKADARTSERYIEAIYEDADAAGELAKLYALREAAAAKIEAWRSQSANYRAMKI
jgi:hypothetical protein